MDCSGSRQPRAMRAIRAGLAGRVRSEVGEPTLRRREQFTSLELADKTSKPHSATSPTRQRGKRFGQPSLARRANIHGFVR
jgi:hypothetical protein